MESVLKMKVQQSRVSGHTHDLLNPFQKSRLGKDMNLCWRAFFGSCNPQHPLLTDISAYHPPWEPIGFDTSLETNPQFSEFLASTETPDNATILLVGLVLVPPKFLTWWRIDSLLSSPVTANNTLPASVRLLSNASGERVDFWRCRSERTKVFVAGRALGWFGLC